MKEEILELLNDLYPSIDFTASDKMAEDGTLDSITIVQIISELSVEYDIEFSLEDITPENLNSLDSITAMVERMINA